MSNHYLNHYSVIKCFKHLKRHQVFLVCDRNTKTLRVLKQYVVGTNRCFFVKVNQEIKHLLQVKGDDRFNQIYSHHKSFMKFQSSASSQETDNVTYWIVPTGTGGQKCLIVHLFLEYTMGGDLFDLVANFHSCISVWQIFDIYLQLVEMVVYLFHAKKMFHRDIKLENIFLHSRKPDEHGRYRIVLGDFGSSRGIKEFLNITNAPFRPIPGEGFQSLWDFDGSIDYIAPEIWFPETLGGRSIQSELWSCHVVLHGMLMNLKFIPILDMPIRETKHHVTSLQRFFLEKKDMKFVGKPLLMIRKQLNSIPISETQREFVASLFHSQPEKRPSVSTLLTWLSENMSTFPK